MTDDAMMHLEPVLEPALATALNLLQPVPPRNAQTAARGRAAFLAEAQTAHADAQPTAAPARSANRVRRSLRWVMAVVAATVLGSAGVVYAAQGSLPDQALYPVKLWSEDARLAAPLKPNERLRLLIEFSQRRVVEMDAVRDRAEVLRATEARLNAQLSEAARVAQTIGDLNDDARQTFEQLQRTLTPAPTFTPTPSPTIAPSATATLVPTDSSGPTGAATALPMSPQPPPQPAQATLPAPTEPLTLTTPQTPTPGTRSRPPGQTVRETVQAIRTALPPKPDVRETAQAIRTALPPKPDVRETAQGVKQTVQAAATAIATRLPEQPKPPLAPSAQPPEATRPTPSNRGQPEQPKPPEAPKPGRP